MNRARFPLIAAGGLLLAAHLAQSLLAQPPSRPGAKPMHKVDQPVMFNTTEADAVVSTMQIFPTDNPWNADVSAWPRHPDSDAIIDSIGSKKPLRYNADMAYILAPADQKKVDVKLVSYPDESDKGPYPLPDNVPIEGWPANYSRNPKTKSTTLDDVQRDKLKENGDRHAVVVDPARGILYEFY